MPTDLLRILQKEIAPALGCTGPTSVSFVVSVARDAVGGTPKSVHVIMDKDGYKNSIAVGIPGTTLMGLDIAAALGAVAGNSTSGLEVLQGVTGEDELKARQLLASTKVDIKWDLKDVELYNEAYVETDKGIGHAIVRRTHTNVVLIEANNKKIYEASADEHADRIDYSRDVIRQYRIRDFYQFAKYEPLDHLLVCREAIHMNKTLAEAGLENGLGSGFGYAFQNMEDQTLILKAKAFTAAASDARMAGLDLPAMSCATSGNVGIAASLPLYVVARELGRSEEELLRSLALSFLTVIYLKSHIGRLSAICACSIASSLGVAAGSAYLLDGNLREIEMAINSVTGSIGGILCDGAKPGCAMKLATSVGVAIEAALLARQGVSIKPRDGIVGLSADESIEAIGRIAREGMITADEVMARIIISRESSLLPAE